MKLAERLRAQLVARNGDQPTLLPGDDTLRAVDAAFVPAAVLIAVTDRPEPGVLLTLRTASLRKHAGQVAFPGGRIDPGDEGPIGAALREAREEIGLEAAHVDIVGLTDSYRTGTGYMITPVVGVVPPDLALSPHAAEVDAIFETPLAHLLDLANYAERETELNGLNRRFREIYWQDYRIWGATAAIMTNFATRIGAWP